MSLLNETVVRLQGVTAPPVSDASEARVYLDSSNNKLYVSENGSSYVQLAVKSNFTAVVDPTSSNDSTQGYAAGSVWLNSASQRLWVCVSAVAAAAIWLQTSDPNVVSVGMATPGQHFYGGGLLSYANSAKVTANEIQYVQLWLTKGVVLTSMKCFVTALPTGNLILGVYDQATPGSISGTPRNKVADTGSFAVGGTGYRSSALSAPYEVPTSGYYWLAQIASSALTSYRSTGNNQVGFVPIRSEAAGSLTLPAVATSADYASATPLLYMAAVE